MSEIRTTCFAEKIVNKGGGIKTNDVWIPEKFMWPETDEKGKTVYREHTMLVKRQNAVKTTGTDYIVFNCPVCNKRNRRHAYDAKVEDKGKALVYRCSGCYRVAEVKKPLDLLSMVEENGGLVGPTGHPIK